MNNIALIVSVALNIGQWFLAWHKDRLHNELEEKRIDKEALDSDKNRKQEIKIKQLSHSQELSKMRLESMIHNFQVDQPKLVKLYSEYLAKTREEINKAAVTPVKFSDQQKKLEYQVMLQCPEAFQQILVLKQENEEGRTFTVLLVCLDDIASKMSQSLRQPPQSTQQSEK